MHIPWRRPNENPEKKAVLVFDTVTGQRLRNGVPISVYREYGDIAFQPVTVPGAYEVYHLPYQPPQHLFDFQERGKYFARQATADPAWMARHHLDGPGLANGRWRALPQAKVLQIQARGESHRFDPMELIATREELAQLLALVPECDYLVFPEDRRFPIRRYGDLPVRWARLPAEEVERPRFAGQAQPGEYRVLCFSVEHVRRKEAHCQCVARHQRPGIQGWKAYQRRGGVLPEPSRPRLAGTVLDAGVFGRAWPGSPPLAGRPRSVGCPRHIPGRCAGEAERPSRDRRPRRN